MGKGVARQRRQVPLATGPWMSESSSQPLFRDSPSATARPASPVLLPGQAVRAQTPSGRLEGNGKHVNLSSQAPVSLHTAFAQRSMSKGGASASNASGRPMSQPSRKRLVSGESSDQAFSVNRQPLSPARPESSETRFRHDRLLSNSVENQNRRTGKFWEKIASASPDASKRKASSPSHVDGDASPGSPMESVDQLVRVFKDEVGALDKIIEELNKNLRMDHLNKDENSKELRRLEQAEAEKRRIEGELRKARLAEKDARDPKRKIQLRLENKRRFEMDTLDKAGIPTRIIEIHSLGVKSSVKMVDVQALTNNCQGLAQGIHSVRELVELQERREKVASVSTMTNATMSSTMSWDMPPLDSLGLDFDFDESLLPSQQTWEDRFQRAQIHRKVIRSENTVRKLNKMRHPPSKLPYSYDVFGYCLPETRGSWETTRQGISKKEIEKELSPLHFLGLDRSDNAGFHQRSDSSPGGASTSRCQPMLIRADRRVVSDEVAARVRKLWRAARGFVNFMLVYFAHMRMMNSQKIVCSFINQMGEWSRMRSSVTHFLWNVREMQRAARQFLNTRRTRCDLMNKEFEKTEDKYLLSFHKLWAHKVVEEAEEAEKKKIVGGQPRALLVRQKTMGVNMNQQKLDKEHMKQTHDFVENTFDWRALRIPLHIRKALIVRYYTTLSMQHLRSKTMMLDSVKTAVKNYAELKEFLKNFNYEGSLGAPVDTANIEMEEVHGEFWHLKEDTAVEIISLAAELLLRDPEYIKRFKEHPANRSEGLPEQEYDRWCRPPRKMSDYEKMPLIGELTGNFVSAVSLFRTRDSSLASNKRRLAKAQVSLKTAPAINSRRKKVNIVSSVFNQATDMDLEDVLQLYTPRLKDIAHQQSVASAASPHDSDSRLDSISALAAQWDLK